MAFRIPTRESKSWLTDGFRQFRGVLTRTFNVDLEQIPGRVRTTRVKKTTDSDGVANFDNPAGSFAFYNGKYFASMASDVFEAEFPEDTFSISSGAPTVNEQDSDMEVFNGDLYVYDNDEFHKLSGTSWSTSVVTGLTDGNTFLLRRFGNRLYYSEDNLFVGSINSSDAKATTTNTLDLSNLIAGTSGGAHVISMLERGQNQLWIATINNLNQPGYIFTWNGETQNTFTSQYQIPDASVLAGTIDRETGGVYVFDTRGRLMQFNGAGFEEVGRINLNGQKLLTSLTQAFRAVHPRGMTIRNGEVLVHVNTKTADGKHHAPSGIWAYSRETGFYHKYSVSQQDVDDTGTTNLVDYGQSFLDREGAVGPIFNAYEVGDNDKNGDLLISSEYFTDLSTRKRGIFVNDTDDNTQKYGWIITTWLESQEVDDFWNGFVVKHKKLINSADKIILKYRTEDYEALTADAVVASSRRVHSTNTELADVLTRFNEGQGYEIRFLTEDNAGFCASVNNIEQQGSAYVFAVDEEIPVSYGDAKIVVENFKRITDQTNQREQFVKAQIGAKSTKIQLKVDMLWTGKNELDELYIDNKTNTTL